MQTPIRILSTKKLLPNQKQFLLNAGFALIEIDFIKIESKTFELENINNNLIFTSQNAVGSFLINEKSNAFKERKVFCVGLKTKASLQENGFKAVESANSASELAEKIKRFKSETFTFFSGNLRLETLPVSMKISGIEFNEVEVYETILSSIEIKTHVDAILFFSPSAVDSYIQSNKISNETCFCIGSTTANALKSITENIIIAKQSTIENVIIQAINYYR